ncbi:hypothetical protein ACF1BQ_025575 [Bradyrhizobium sp. RDT10]
MSDERWMIFVVVGVLTAMIMARLDRLGKQIEAVSVMIRSDLARSGEERDEVIQEWNDNKQQAAKDARQFWAFWGIVGAAALGWYLFAHYR